MTRASDVGQVVSSASTLSALLAQCEQLSRSTELFVISHNPKTLHRLDGAGEAVADEGLIDELLGCSPASYDELDDDLTVMIVGTAP